MEAKWYYPSNESTLTTKVGLKGASCYEAPRTFLCGIPAQNAYFYLITRKHHVNIFYTIAGPYSSKYQGHERWRNAEELSLIKATK